MLALSTGEAELMSLVKGTTELLGIQSIYSDFGLCKTLRMDSDASAAIGIVSRLGLGKVRHLAVSDLWVQGIAKKGLVDYRKIDGKETPSDALTKPLDGPTLYRHTHRMGLIELTGRPEIAPIAKSQDGA